MHQNFLVDKSHLIARVKIRARFATRSCAKCTRELGMRMALVARRGLIRSARCGFDCQFDKASAKQSLVLIPNRAIASSVIG